MTSENLVTVPVGTTLEEAAEKLHAHRIEKLLVVDAQGELQGLITVKDIQKKLDYPRASKDELGRLRVRRGRGRRRRRARARAELLIEAGVDLLVRRHRARPLPQRARDGARASRRPHPDQQVMAGNIATGEAARGADRRGRRRGQGGHRAGLDLHDARGGRRRRAPDHARCWTSPRVARQHGVPVVADGGMQY